MTKTAKTGAGRLGNLLGVPNGTPSDESIVYYQNDISSHLYKAIPRKTNQDVAGELPSRAMPIPYTKSCGQPCHVTAPLQFPKPTFPLQPHVPAQLDIEKKR